MLYLHHVNMVSFLYTIHYCAYIFSLSPTFADPKLNDILCYISSIIWLITQFMRMNSILLLGLYRYTAVYFIKFHRDLNRSVPKMIMGIIVTWVYSIMMSFVLKYSFNTTYSIFYCFEGDSPDLNIVAWFMVVNTIISIGIPSVLIVILYVLIIKKIKNLNKNLIKKKNDGHSRIWSVLSCKTKNRIQETEGSIATSINFSSSPSSTLPSTLSKLSNSKKNKQTSLALQFILINGINIFGSIFSILINFSLKLATSGDNLNLITDFQYIRPLFRLFFILAQSLIPILSILLTPWKQ